MAELKVSLEGLDKVLQYLDTQRYRRAVRLGLEILGAEVHNLIATYPPATIANSPANPTGRWYQRGYGPRWRRKDGSVGGRKTSQQLGQSWTTKVSNWQAVVGTKATYAPFVQSAEDQAAFHKARGWKTDQDVLQEVVVTGKARRAFETAILRVLW